MIRRTSGTGKKVIFSDRKVLACLLMLFIFMAYVRPVYAEIEKKTLPSGISYDEIGERVETFVKEHEATMAGMEMAVFDRDGIIYQNYFGYTDKEKKVLTDQDSVFEWGSVTKTLIWVSAMQLYEEGKLDLDADIRTYLPEGFLTNLNYDMPITMLNLMNHDAGFQELLSDMFLEDPDDVLILAEQLKLHEPEQIYEPGSVAAYSNWSAGLAAYIVELISGQSFDAYVKEHIFEPLGMERTAIRADLSDNEYVRKKREELMCYKSDGTLKGNCNYAVSLYPVGRCTSTLEDMAIYAQAFIPYEEQTCPLFQKKETLMELFSATSYYGDTEIPRSCHGLWTEEYAVSVLGHGGNSEGCSAHLLLEPESGVGAVVLTNQQAETCFNDDMMELVFGSFDDSQLSEYGMEVPKGVFRDARTILKGPFSMMGLGIYIFKEGDINGFFVSVDSQQQEKIEIPYGDFLKLKKGEYIPMLGLLFLGIAGCVYAACTCLIGGCIVTPLLKIRKKRRGIKTEKIPYSLWNYISCGLILLWLVNLTIIIWQASSYAHSSHYVWQFALGGILGILMLVMAVFGIVRFKTIEQPVKIKGKYAMTVFFLFVYIAVILYWQTYQFWAL